MASNTVARSTFRSLSRTKSPWKAISSEHIASSPRPRCLHIAAAAPSYLSSSQRTSSNKRPRISAATKSTPLSPLSRRTIFIQTETTPNEDALKFNPNTRVLPETITSGFLEYLSPRSTLAPPHPSPLAASLLGVDGVTSVFFGVDYITVTKSSDTPWAHVKPEVFSIINEFVLNGTPMVKTVADTQGESGQESMEKDSLAYDENDSETVSMIKELLETRIRPAIQEDGGDIEFRGFEDGQVMLKLRGACRTCDSSTVTLKNGIESMLMHYIDQVKGVQQVLDQEEEVAIQEFARFEEKLRQARGEAPASTVGKDTLDHAM